MKNLGQGRSFAQAMQDRRSVKVAQADLNGLVEGGEIGRVK
jgi:hypothetical protein